MKSLYLPAILFCITMSSCSTTQYQVETARDLTRIIPEECRNKPSPVSGTSQEMQLRAAVENLNSLAVQLSRLQTEVKNLDIPASANKRGHFTSDETDRIENLLFRYLACRESLWDLIACYGNPAKTFSGSETETKAFTIGFSAAVLLSQFTSGFVSSFIDDSMTIRKLNEKHIRYGLPSGSFDMLFDSITSRENIGALRDAQKYFSEELSKPESTLAIICSREPDYRKLAENSEEQFKAAEKSIEYILKKRAILLPDTANLIRQNALLKQAKKARKDISDNLYIAQGLLFNSISDIKRPMTPPADFTPDQVETIKSMMKPGDLLFTFTAGYMSNVFLPGKFKHGITYVGHPEQRIAAGLTPDGITGIPSAKKEKLLADLKTGKLESGYDADVIEAVAEGVIFNSIDYLLKHHINRCVVLRPRIAPADRNSAILNTFLLLGGQYDFNFDFSDASNICCTEAIYRSWNRRANIDFKLVRRGLVQTLSADDIIDYHLSLPEPLFDVIFVAEENPISKTSHVILHTGHDASKRLKSLMAEKSIQFPVIGKNAKE